MLMLNKYIDFHGTEKIDSLLFENNSALYEYLNSLLGPFPNQRIKIKRMVSNKDFPINFNVPDNEVFFYEIVEF